MRWLGFSNAPPSRSGGGALAWRAAGGSKSLGYIFWNVDKRMSSTLIGSGMDESDESESASTSNKGQYFFVCANLKRLAMPHIPRIEQEKKKISTL
ncbi:uncharacterized protein LOC101771503 isoform X4 [Setaria italica]|uniref:uncharacterized protein LOC101771503 isoform X4 n=1 Tax=Setaria italica TaxID=4555 RepID=UPI000BE4DD13|nr:uncharacterized protein LOC101771503 isoform X4 [Setaria italica]